jgi:hypothetical protein
MFYIMTNTNNLQNRVLVYSLTTDAFFNDAENGIAKDLMNLRVEKKELLNIKDEKKTNNKEANDKVREKINTVIAQEGTDELEVIETMLSEIEASETELSKELEDLIKENKDVRELRHDALFTTKNINGIEKEVNKSNKVVALFESSFTRGLELDTKNVNDSVIIVKVYHYDVLKSLIDKKFMYKGKTWKFWSSSAGQMKNKKCVFVKESALAKEHENEKGKIYTVEDKLTCGLSWDKINNTTFKKGDKEESGINNSKYLAYLSLQNTATTKWTEEDGFNINKVLVCPDLEIDVTDTVEFIDRDTYKIYPPEEKTLPMNVSDGVGLILPELSEKNFQFRIPWGKGLLSSFDFVSFIEKANKANPSKNHAIVTDVWGDKHDVIEEGIQIILSASQLKTWKYYNSMEEYRTFFEKYQCEAGKCNEEVDTKDIHLNYQYIQSLVDMTYSELDDITRATNYDIHNIGSSKSVMMRSLGATEENEKKNYFQQALLMYPNLINDNHAKEMIKSKKKAMVTDGKAGTLRVEGKRMFVLPDLYAYCEFLFKGDNNPNGLLGKGEVFAKDIKEGTVDIMRSPSLYREHGIAENTKNAELEEWFKTGAIVVNNKNFLSRLLQFDFDGDQVNICFNKQLTKVAKRNMRGIVPLYYEMSTAPIQKLSKKSIYDSLELSFGSSIGSISNDITKIWNSAGEFTKDKLDTLKFLTMYNNYMIDFSKTGFLPKPKGDAKKLIKKFAAGDMPYFFQFAKGKEKVASKVVDGHTPVVNMLDDIIVDKRISFKTVADKFDYTNLMSVNKFKSKGKDLDDAIIKAYTKVNKSKKWMIDKDSDDYKENKYVYVARVIKEDIMEAARAIDEKVTDLYVADVLIHHLHNVKKTGNKKTLWESFGDILVANLNYKLNGIKVCQHCDGEFEAKTHKEKYCSDECKVEAGRENTRKRVKKSRSK